MDSGWYLIRSKPKSEQRAVDHLSDQDFKVYCPFIVQSKRAMALFPQYLFIYLSENDTRHYHKIRNSRGVDTFVCFQNYDPHNTPSVNSFQLPQPIPNGEQVIAQVVHLEQEFDEFHQSSSKAVQHFQEGDEVSFSNPLFQCLKATYIKRLNLDYGMILLQYIQNYRFQNRIHQQLFAEKRIQVPLNQLSHKSNRQ